MLTFLKVILVLLFVLEEANGTLIPNGTISLDCGDQQTFTCTVPVGTALWRIVRLIGINAAGSGGGRAASENERIINPLANGAASSTITIIGFNASDDGGTIQCTYDDGLTSTVEGMAIISVEPPSCPTSFSANRDDDFTNITVTYQLATPPPVTSTTVTYCPTSSPNCGNSMNCITSPCTISGLDPCVEYILSAIPNNNCRSPTGCTENSMVVASRGVPSCPSSVVAVAQDDNDAITVAWQQPPNTPPVTSTTVTYCPTSSPNCGNSTTCTSPCTISGLDPGTEYHFTVIPSNNCGSPTGCIGNTAIAQTACICPKSALQPSPPVEAPLLAGIVPTVVLLLANVVTGVVAVLITRHCYKKTSQKSSPSKGEDVYDQVEGPKTYEDIEMTDSPAYGPVK